MGVLNCREAALQALRGNPKNQFFRTYSLMIAA